MTTDKVNALEMLDENLTEFDELEKKLRMDGMSEYLRDEYKEIYQRSVQNLTEIFSEDESLSFTQQSSVPTYDLDYEEENEIYQQSIVECIRMLEEYRQKI